MKFKTIGIWLISIIIMLSSLIYQRKTGPTYPLKGTIKIDETKIIYNLPRSANSGEDKEISIKIPKKSTKALLLWRRYRFDKEWKKVQMKREGEKVYAFLPSQPPAGKLEYFIVLKKNKKTFHIPEKSAVIRFKGKVPPYILIPHILFMFLAMLFSVRTGLEAILNRENLKTLTYTTFILLLIGGFFLGPIVQKYAFGEFWTGIPFGWDLTDNKTLIAGIFWLIAVFNLKDKKKARIYVLIASIVMLIVYLIPHSALGSSFDYSKGKVVVGKK